MTDVSEHAISVTDLRQLSSRLVKQQQLAAPDWDQRSAPLAGHMWVSELEPGLQLRLADVHDHVGLKSQAILPAGIKIALVMKGSAHVCYGPHDAHLGPYTGGSPALMAVLPNSTPFTRHGQAGSQERTLTLSLSPHWLVRQGHHLLASGHLVEPRLVYWTPSHGLLALAERLFKLEPASASGGAHRLQLTGFALALAGEALAAVPSDLPGHSSAQAVHDRRLARLMSLIDSGQARDNTQQALARQLGMSVSTLQRHFMRHYGEPLGGFLRRHYLWVARRALEEQAITIETAANLAGYRSATSFATAFKREYGVQPREYRQAAAGV